MGGTWGVSPNSGDGACFRLGNATAYTLHVDRLTHKRSLRRGSVGQASIGSGRRRVAAAEFNPRDTTDIIAHHHLSGRAAVSLRDSVD